MSVEDTLARILKEDVNYKGSCQDYAREIIDALDHFKIKLVDFSEPPGASLMIGEPIESTRDRFAMHALGLMMRDGADLLLSSSMVGGDQDAIASHIKSVAKMSFAVADAMIEARDEFKTPPIWSVREAKDPGDRTAPGELFFEVLCPDNVWRSCVGKNDHNAAGRMIAAWDAGTFETKPAPLGI